MDEPAIVVKGEDDGRILGEERVEIRVAQPVRVLNLRLQLHEVNDVDHANSELG